MTEQSVDHQIGRISGRMDSVEREVSRLEQRLDERLRSIDTSLDQIQATLSAAGGSWRTLMWVGAAVTAMATILAAVVHWITGK
jgi:prefoldin subunit 5